MRVSSFIKVLFTIVIMGGMFEGYSVALNLMSTASDYAVIGGALLMAASTFIAWKAFDITWKIL
jgi:hypothetical protein